MSIRDVDLNQPAPEAVVSSAKETVNIWIEIGPTMQKVVARGDITVIFAHTAGEPIDKWRMLSAPRETVAEKLTFMALYRTMTEYGQGKGWIAPAATSSGIKHSSIVVPMARLPELQAAIKAGNLSNIRALGANDVSPAADPQE